MSREELRAAVIEPLKLAGVTERDAADLADAVVRDAGDEPGELALLQMALWRTWARRHEHGNDLLSAYGAIGRVEGALAQAAQEVFTALSADDRHRAETLFVRLVRPGETGGVTRRIGRAGRIRPASAGTRAATFQGGTVTPAHVRRGHGRDRARAAGNPMGQYQQWISNVGEDRRGDDLRTLHALIPEAAAWQDARAAPSAIDLPAAMSSSRAALLPNGARIGSP